MRLRVGPVRALAFVGLWYLPPTYWIGSVLWRTRRACRGWRIHHRLAHIFGGGDDPWQWSLLKVATIWPAMVVYIEYRLWRTDRDG